MSPAGPRAVRTTLQPVDRSGRTLDQRLAVRFPVIGVAGMRRISGLPPDSRLRRRTLARAVTLSLAAYNRRDLTAVVSAFPADFEYRPAQHWVDAGVVEASYRGIDAYRRYVTTLDQVWGGENLLEPIELIDLGRQFVTLATGRMRGQASGVALTEEYALVSTFDGGQLVLHQEYYDHDQALAAVGLATDRASSR
jgi:ketosteroid isomerase-like protein